MITVEAELNHRRLLETRLAIETAERAQLKVLAEARRVAEENRVKLESEKLKQAEAAGKYWLHLYHLMIHDWRDPSSKLISTFLEFRYGQ